jgi:TRAP-type mannitol/chloroaromatic compound transport system substrate-binding protein
MHRRQALTGVAAAGLVTAASAFPKPAISQGRRELRMATTWPKNLPGQGTSAERMAQNIGKWSEGKLTMRVYGAGELVPAFEVYDAAGAGVCDMYHGADYYWQGKSQSLNFFTVVPFGLTGGEMNAWLHSGGQELWDEVAATFNLKSFAAGNTGVQMAGWFNKEINSAEDFKGLTMRMPGLGAEVIRQLGATAVNLPAGEIYAALQSGAIDATEFVGPWNDLTLGFHQVASYYYWPGIHEPATLATCGINLGLWNEMSDWEKSIIEAAARYENDMLTTEFDVNNVRALDQLINQHGVQLRKMPDDVIAAMRTAAADVVATSGASDPLTAKVYEHWSAFKKQAAEWTTLSIQGYLDARSG